MRNLFVLLMSLAFFNSAYASNGPGVFSGNWSGEGKYIYEGDMTNCPEFNLNFVGGNGRFTFINGNRVCEKHKESFPPINMSYKEGKFFFNGQVVGAYAENFVELSFRMPDGDSFRNWRMSMRKEGNHLVYEESRTMEGETTPLISFAGLLVLQK